jgi:hypothetical protein
VGACRVGLQALTPNVPVLPFGLRVNPRLTRTALLAGAHGFIHLGTEPRVSDGSS